MRDDVVALIGWGPLEVGGTTWYEAIKLRTTSPGTLPSPPEDAFYPPSSGNLAGWIAVAGASGDTVSALAPRCPTTRDLANVASMLAGERLACFGNARLTLEGTYGCGGCGGTDTGTYTPEWLAGPEYLFLSVRPQDRLGPLDPHFPPAVARPEEGTILRLVGHVDDARASTCEVSFPEAAVSHDVAVTLCRQRFVVDSYEILGVDPSFPPV